MKETISSGAFIHLYKYSDYDGYEYRLAVGGTDLITMSDPDTDGTVQGFVSDMQHLIHELQTALEKIPPVL